VEGKALNSIDGSTRVLGVFGYPVSHSFSPLMHNRALRLLGLNAVYVAFEVHPNHLEQAVAGIRALNVRGVNVTIPHKETVMRHLDSMAPPARLIGAVNTIINDEGRLTGENTDGEGFVRGLSEELGVEVRGRRVLILGAGGSARAVGCALALNGAASVTWVNRNPMRAQRLAAEFGAALPETSFDAAGQTEATWESALPKADLLVNCTSVGMSGHGDWELPLDLLPRGAVVSDIVYRPARTKLLESAEAAGLPNQNGLAMLAYQGILSFAMWLEQEPPEEVVMAVLRTALE